MHYCFISIFACEYSCLSLLLTICRLIVSKQLWIKSLKWNMSLVYCVIQSSFHVHDPPRSLLLMLELKGLSLIHMQSWKQFQGKPTFPPALSNQQLLLGIFGFWPFLDISPLYMHVKALLLTKPPTKTSTCKPRTYKWQFMVFECFYFLSAAPLKSFCSTSHYKT